MECNQSLKSDIYFAVSSVSNKRQAVGKIIALWLKYNLLQLISLDVLLCCEILNEI